MGSLNRKNSFMYNKSGFIISEALIIPFSILIVSIMIFLASSISIADGQKFEELTPVLNYEFPKVVVYSFLNFPISSEDSLTFFGDDKQHFVVDLIWIDTDQADDLVREYKDKYLNLENLDFKNQIKLYSSFSGVKIDFDEILYIDFKPSTFHDLEKVLDSGNFFLRVPREYSQDSIIYFKSYSGKTTHVSKRIG